MDGIAAAAAAQHLEDDLGREMYARLRAASWLAALKQGGTVLLQTAERVVLYWSTLRDIDIDELGGGLISAKTLGRKLRENPAAAKARHWGLVNTYNAALGKLPDYRGMVLRGITVLEDDLPDFLKLYQKGRVVVHEDFTHTTLLAEVPDAYQGNVEFVIASHHGKHIAPWSRYPDTDSEVAFKLGTAFMALNTEVSDGVHVIHLREIAED